jgi:histidine triad (HIT) family protein
LTPDGINLIQANGPGAAQSVPHFHMHILPRWKDDGLLINWHPTPGDMNAIKALHERILKNL